LIRVVNAGCKAAQVADNADLVQVVAGAATPIAQLLADGAAVVLVDTDAEALARAVRRAGPGARLAVFVGDPDEASVRAHAEVMALELFGAPGEMNENRFSSPR
jgi:hypothetical protein